MSRCSGTVIEADDHSALIELPERAGSCGNCAQPGGCQSGLLGLRSGPRRYRVGNSVGVRAGDEVSLLIADGVLLRASLFSYVIPVIAAIFGAGVGHMASGGSDAAAVAGLLLGLLLSGFALRYGERRFRRTNPGFLLQRLPRAVSPVKELS